jgi:hypothetical protein
MRTRAILRLLAALFVLALLAAACGEDDEPTTAGDASSGTDMSGTDDDGDADHDDDADHEPDGEMAADHGHGMVEVAADGAPSVDIEVSADPAGGVNIHVISEDYAVTPRAASTEHVDGEGHFHLFVDGEKVLRFYNEWIYFAGVTEGEAVIAVELSANDHRAYAVDGERILAETTFVVPEHSHDAHSHGEATSVEFVGVVPTLEVEVVDDPESGWNAFVSFDGFVLSPENASGDHVDGEGHLHIYANGQKLGRLYGPATHIGALPEGDVEISVVAYTNDHDPYVIDGQPVSAATTVTVAS